MLYRPEALLYFGPHIPVRKNLLFLTKTQHLVQQCQVLSILLNFCRALTVGMLLMRLITILVAEEHFRARSREYGLGQTHP